jgi:glycosyltransferase involved in cell wall biosynthesis
MNVLMISDVYFPRVNGVSTSIETFRKELSRRGASVTLVAPDYGGHGEEEDIIRIPSKKVMFDPEDRMMSYGAILEQKEELRNRQFDLVHIQTPFVAHYAGVALAKELGLPKIVTYHTFFEEYLYHYIPFLPASWMRALARRFSRTQCNDVDGIVVPSHAMAKTLEQYGIQKPLHLIPTGIPEAMFESGERIAFRDKYGIAHDTPMMLFVGRVAFEKNIEFLLHATDLARRQIPELLLVIAGEGPALRSIEKLACTLRLEKNVRMIGYLDREKGLKDCYSAADLFVFASRTETQGLVLLEAMAAGVPVISTAHMGTKDILKEESGAVVPQDDIGEFAAAIVHMISEVEKRSERALQAHRYARIWSSGAMADKMRSLYKNMKEGSSTGASITVR